MKKKGILVLNLGTPDSYSVKDVSRYLKQFLMDPYVIDKPYWSRYLLVNFIIRPFRSRKSSDAYKKIWTTQGSPLLIESQKFSCKLKTELKEEVVLGMRYGNPSIEFALNELYEKNVEEIFVLPMYPQFADSSTLTAIEEVRKYHKKEIPIKYLKPFYKEKKFIQNLGEKIRPYWQTGEYDHLLLSYHGLPERHILKYDSQCGPCFKKSICEARESDYCYRSHCFQTTKNVIENLGLSQDQYSTTFQSRLGRDPWIRPYTDLYIKDLVNRGVKKLLVVTPSFTVDCLETLEEVAMALSDDFIGLGGEKFQFVPCLNDQDSWVSTVKNWVEDSPQHLFQTL